MMQDETVKYLDWQQHVRRCRKLNYPIFKCSMCGYETDGKKDLQTFKEEGRKTVLIGGQRKEFNDHLAKSHGTGSYAMANLLNALVKVI